MHVLATNVPEVLHLAYDPAHCFRVEEVLVGRDQVEVLQAAVLRVHDHGRLGGEEVRRPFEAVDARVKAEGPVEFRVRILEAVGVLEAIF